MPYRDLQPIIERLARHIEAGPVATKVPAKEIRRHLEQSFDLATPMPFTDLFSKVTKMLDRWQVQVTHPRYFGLFNPSVTTASVVADTLVAAYNPQLAAWSHSPAANEIERFTLRALAARLGLDPETTASHFTSGGAEANLTALLAALAHTFPSWREQGLRSLPAQPRFYLSQEGHHSFHKAARVSGLGDDAVVTIPVDAGGRMRLGALEAAVEADRRAGFAPMMVVATAGTTGSGAIDPLAETAAFCRRQPLWLHIDAAWAGAAALSPKLRPHLAAIDQADSLTFDAHKWLAVPMGAGMFFCRHPTAVKIAFDQHTPYMPAPGGGATEDPYSRSLQWSRRFIGLKLFVTLAEVGFPGVIERIESQTDLGDELRRLLTAAGWRIANDTPLPVVCFTRPGVEIPSLVRQLHHRQIAWMSPIRIGGGPLLVRACITGHRTTSEDLVEVVARLAELV